jgi:hypothetical protein
VTGTAPGRPRPAGRLGSGCPGPLPGRPLLTTPPHLQDQTLLNLQRQRLAAQPWLGLGGVLLGAAVFFALALGTGNTATSLLILGPISTFALPTVAMVAFWWNDWPGSQLTTPWTGLVGTVLVAAAAVVLAIAGQAIVERPGLRGVFEASPGPGVPTTFPATLALAGAAFTAMLQLSLVCERWPLGGTWRLRSGIAALALSWGAGTGAYFLFVNTAAIPAAERAATGLRNPGGPIAAPDFGSALIAVGLWQAVFFIALRGWPVNTITHRPARLLVGNEMVTRGASAPLPSASPSGAGPSPGKSQRRRRCEGHPRPCPCRRQDARNRDEPRELRDAPPPGGMSPCRAQDAKAAALMIRTGVQNDSVPLDASMFTWWSNSFVMEQLPSGSRAPSPPAVPVPVPTLPVTPANSPVPPVISPVRRTDPGCSSRGPPGQPRRGCAGQCIRLTVAWAVIPGPNDVE